MDGLMTFFFFGLFGSAAEFSSWFELGSFQFHRQKVVATPTKYIIPANSTGDNPLNKNIFELANKYSQCNHMSI